MIDLTEPKSSGMLLRYLREKRGYSLRQLATKAYLGKSNLERYEHDVALPPSKQTLDCLIAALGCSEQEALTLEYVWLVDLLAIKGVERERAKAMVFSVETILGTHDFEQIFSAAHEAIKHDAFENALRWLEPIWNMHQAVEEILPALEYHLGEAKYGSGHLAEAGEHFKRTLQLIGHSPPESVTQRFLSICFLTARQVWNRIRPERISGLFDSIEDAREDKSWQMVVDACYRLSHIYYLNNNRGLAFYYSLKGLNLAEGSHSFYDSNCYQALFFANMATATGFSGLHPVARMYIRHIETLEQNLDAQQIDDGVDLVLGVYFFGRAEWKDCEARFERAARVAEDVGNLRRARESEAFLASAYYWQGRWTQSFSLFDRLYRKAKQSGDYQIMALAFFSKALRSFHRGRLDYSLGFALIAECLAREKLQDCLVQIQVNGLLIAIYSRLNNMDKANQHAKAIEELSRYVSTTAGTLEGYYQLAEYYLKGWEMYGAKDFEKGAKTIIRMMVAHARIFDVFRPLAWSYRGWYEFLLGKPDKAMRFINKGIHEAQVLKMPYHEKLALDCLTNIKAHSDRPS